jgi:hypothetical protein
MLIVIKTIQISLVSKVGFMVKLILLNPSSDQGAKKRFARLDWKRFDQMFDPMTFFTI